MSFGRELQDFVAGFKTGADVVSQVRKNKIAWEKVRQPTDAEIDAMPGMDNSGFAIPEVLPPDRTTTGSSGNYRDAIASIESAGTKDPYRAMGPVVNRQGDRALGRYQVMASNVAPWSKQVLGREITTDEFLANDDLQDRIFDSIFGGYVQKYGERGAAQAWFGGPGAVGTSNRKDINGMSTGTYGDRFVRALGGSGTAVAGAAPTRRQVAQATEAATPVIPETEGAAPPEDYTAEVSFDLPEAYQPEISDWTEFMRRGQPTLMAAKGGMIPEYADGGKVDPYNPHRAYTQPLAAPAGGVSTFTPRRVGQAPIDRAPQPAGPTPSQLALRQGRAKLAQPPAPVAPAQPVNQTVRQMEYDAMLEMMNRGSRGRLVGGRPTYNAPLRQQFDYYSTKAGRDAFMGGTDPSAPGINKWLMNYRERLGPVSASFARGGIVTVDPEYWESALKRERGAGGDEQDIRDRAARRINRERRGVESSAIRVGRRAEEAKTKSRERTEKRRAASTQAPAPVSPPLPTPRPGVVIADRDVGSPSTAAVVPDDRATRFRRDQLPVGAPVDRPGRLSDEYVLPSPADQPVDLPGVVGTGTGRVSDEYVLPDQPGYLRRLMVEGMEPPVDFRAIAEDYMSRGGVPEPEVMPPRVVRPPADMTPGPRFSTPPVAVPQPRAEDVVPGGWVGRGLPDRTLEDRATRQQAIPLVPQRTVVRPPVSSGGAVMQSTGEGGLSRVPNAWFIERDGVLYQVNPKTLDFTPVPSVDPSAMFQQGGMIPDPSEPLHGRRPEEYAPGARTAPPRVQTGPGQNETRQYQDVKPTKKLLDHVAQALDGGIRFLTNHFGLRGSGAVPSPDDATASRNGAARFASGEGRATDQEIQQIDDAVDPDRQLDEDARQMTRLAKTTQWYLQRGRKDDAEAAAGSLMMYGAHRFGQLGQLAGAAYRQYQKTGDPQHLDNTIKFMEKAYKMIPDGGRLDVSLNPETKQLQVTRLAPTGEETTYDVTPEELQSLVRSAQNTSTYWQQMFRLADPEGAKARDIDRRQEARDIRTEQRVQRRDDYLEDLRFERETRAADRSEAAADRRHRESIAAADRRAAEEQRRYERNQADKDGNIDWAQIAPVRAAAEAARNAMANAADPKVAQANFDDKASRLFDVLSGMTKDPAKAMDGLGITSDDYQYVAKKGVPYRGETPPPNVPEAKRAPDGNWYTGGPGKYRIVEEE